MKKTTEEKIIKVGNFIVENHATKKQVQDKFNLTKSTIRKYINDKDKLQSLDYDLYLKVKKVQDDIIEVSTKKGGQVSSRIKVTEDEEIKIIAKDMLKRKLTLLDASIIYGEPINKLYERLKNLNDDKINKYLEKQENKY